MRENCDDRDRLEKGKQANYYKKDFIFQHYIDYEKVSVTLSKDIEISKEWLTSSLNSLKENNNACDKENSTVVG